MERPGIDRSRRIMLCTADPSLHERLLPGLQSRGFQVSVAVDADSALFQLNVVPPDVMLCDQGLPGYEGMALLQMIRRDRGDLAAMPIIVMSEYGHSSDIAAAKMAGADDYAVKPVDINLIVASIEAQLRIAARLRSAMLVEEELADGAPRIQAFHRLLDGLSFGIVLFDSHGQQIFTNRNARQLSRAHAARIRSWVLRQVAQLGREAQSESSGIQFPLLDFRMIPTGLSRGNAAQQLFVATMALTPKDDPEMILASMIFATSHQSDAGGRLVSDAIGLTPTEARLAHFLAEGLRLDQIGELMNIAKPTVNYHLRNIYQKSGTSRQSDLITLLRAVHLAEPPGGPAGDG